MKFSKKQNNLIFFGIAVLLFSTIIFSFYKKLNTKEINSFKVTEDGLNIKIVKIFDRYYSEQFYNDKKISSRRLYSYLFYMYNIVPKDIKVAKIISENNVITVKYILFYKEVNQLRNFISVELTLSRDGKIQGYYDRFDQKWRQRKY